MEQLESLKKLAYDYMATGKNGEGLTLRQVLIRGSNGLTAAEGRIADIVRGVSFNDHPYTGERQSQMAEHLGELMFYWLMLASTVNTSPEEIIQGYVNVYKIKNNQMSEEMHVSIKEMMKHVKSSDMTEEMIQNKIDEKSKQRTREQLLK